MPVKPRLFASVSFLLRMESHFELSRSEFHLSRSGTPASFAIEVRNESVTYPEFSSPWLR